ncbi:RNB domain-containing ribonuclease [Mycobacterium cookii]|uniref:RNB domain-containing ribonuclease n=1 Tax=Nocardioides furvisabuli TaxID=375542 RepID=A0ABP5J2P6_9ACTN|nr:RNB domain-containing ribonuclease [Nocardioides furvisabuli]
MPSNRVVKVRSSGDGVTAQEMRDGIAAIQQEMQVSAAFPEEVERAASQAAAEPRLPDLDRTDIELVTIDPESARDLDQALHIERDPDTSGGYVVHYAIADVAAFVTPGDPVDVEANRRGETLYGADSKIPLHPTVLSEDTASLLPDQVRPALLWTIKVDETGEGTDVQVERALVRSRAKLSYDQVQADVDAGRESELIGLLREVGELRLAREASRGGVSLPLPEQELVEAGEGHWELEFRRLTPVETWNAQISLLTGMAAASLMVYARVGVLRTLPPADPRDVQRLHRTARALGIAWPAEQLYPDFVRTLDPSRPTHAAMIVACTRLLRGAGYVTFNGELPEQAQHSALASEYAHVTAPLRRLVDRYAGEVCVALCAGTEVPEWVVAAMTELPDTMRESGRRANQYENAIVNLCEAELLHDRVGERFAAVVVEVDEKDATKGDITIEDPAIEASVRGERDLPLGEEVTVELVQADPASRSVEFRLV